MNSERYEAVGRAFKRAVGLEGEELEQFLGGLDSEGFDLRKDVEEMLEMDAENDDAFAESKLERGRERLEGLIHESPNSNLGFPERVGPYRLVEEIGRGGQARVFLARDTRLPRVVALKVLERANFFGEEELTRLRREAESTSRLNHPHISRIFEYGEFDGGLYIAMQYVEGESLAEALASRGKPGNALELPTAAAASDSRYESSHSSRKARGTVARVVEFVESTARALHVAHELGIVHRDVKPGNIMVTREGTPVVLDFGLARDEASDLASITRTGALIGTPAYMSPEQLTGQAPKVDASLDIYALGVVLYQCSTGKRPFEGATFDALRSEIISGYFRRARQVNPLIPRDLDVVISTAMEVDPGDRFLSALDLAEELRRIRLNEPILTRPPTLVRRTVKWSQRHPALTGFGVLLSVALAIITVLYLRMSDAFEEADREATRAAAINDFLLDRVLGAASPKNMGPHVKVMDVLSLARDELDVAFGDQPMTAASLRLTLGSAYAKLDELEIAETLLLEANDAFDELIEDEDEESLRAELELAELFYAAARTDESRELLERMVPKCENVLGKDSELELKALSLLGACLAFHGDAQGGEEYLVDAVRRAEASFGPDHPVTTAVIRNHAQFLLGPDARKAVEILEDLVERVERNPTQREFRLGGILQSLSRAQLDAGLLEDSERSSQRCIEIMSKVFGEGSIPAWAARHQYALVLREMRRFPESSELLRQAAEKYAEVMGPDSWVTHLYRNDYAVGLRFEGKVDLAREIALEVLEQRQLTNAPAHRIAESLGALAAIELRAQNLEASSGYYDEAVGIAREIGNPYLEEENLYGLAMVLKNMNRPEEAELALRELQEVERELFGEKHPYYVMVVYQIGTTLISQGRYAEAVDQIQDAVDRSMACLPAGHRDIHLRQVYLGQALVGAGRFEEAIEVLITARDTLAHEGHDGIFERHRGHDALELAKAGLESAE